MSCVAISDHAHAIDIDTYDVMREKTTESASVSASLTVDVSIPGEEQGEIKETEPPVAIETSPPSTQTNNTEDFIVSPMPTKALLPISETEGMTSGAVQPPGSTGLDTIFSPSQSSHDNFTELGEGYGETEELEMEVEPTEDDGDALILNGGWRTATAFTPNIFPTHGAQMSRS